MTDPNASQAEFWRDITPSWLLGEQHSELVAAPFGEAARQRLGVAPGERVLDVGCGSGGTTRALADDAAPDGAVVGVDIAPGLVEVARERSTGLGTGSTLSFETADAQTAAVGGAPFDAVYSRFGVMFFADPVAAFTNLARSMRPGGRLAFCCWRDLFENEWMFVPGSAVIAATGEFPPMPGPGEPGPFSLADPELITTVLTAAGFGDVSIEADARVIDLDAEHTTTIREMSRHVGPVREALRSADEAMSATILAAVEEALVGKVGDGRLRLTAAANIVSATR